MRDGHLNACHKEVGGGGGGGGGLKGIIHHVYLCGTKLFGMGGIVDIGRGVRLNVGITIFFSVENHLDTGHFTYMKPFSILHITTELAIRVNDQGY